MHISRMPWYGDLRGGLRGDLRGGLLRGTNPQQDCERDHEETGDSISKHRDHRYTLDARGSD